MEQRRLCLTGTPMPHSPMDIFMQYRFLDPSIFGNGYTRFRSEYAVMGGFEGKVVVAYQNEDKLARKVGEISMAVKKGDVLDLPPVVHQIIPVELSKIARAKYNEFFFTLETEINDEIISADNVLVKLLRLQQITSGYLKSEVDGTIHRICEAKNTAVAEIIDNLPDNEPVVVFCRFTEDLKSVRACAGKAGRGYRELSGHNDELAEWQSLGGVLGVQIQSGGVGIDLTKAAYCIYYSTDYNLGNYEQSLARLDRGGQARSVTYYHLVAEKTVDKNIYEVLDKRKQLISIVESLIESIKKGAIK